MPVGREVAGDTHHALHDLEARVLRVFDHHHVAAAQPARRGRPQPVPRLEGRQFAVQAWWIMLFPGFAISLAALGMNLLGDGLRDVLDPRLKVES